MKKGEIVSLRNLLAMSNVAQMSSNGRIAITRNYMATKNIAKELEDARKQAEEKLITDDFKALQVKENKTDEEKIEFEKLAYSIDKEISEILSPMYSEECELDLKTIDEDEFNKLIGGSTLFPKLSEFLHEMIVTPK